VCSDFLINALKELDHLAFAVVAKDKRNMRIAGWTIAINLAGFGICKVVSSAQESGGQGDSGKCSC